MANITQAYNKMYTLDELAAQKTAIHRINPVIKVIVTLVYIITVVSYKKYEISGIIPLFLYPFVLMGLGNIPGKVMLAGLAIASPLVIGAGIFNPIFDRSIVLNLWGMQVSSGMLSFMSLIIKCCLTVMAALLLLATTGIANITAALQKLRIPDIFTTQLLLTYRYISVLAGETGRISDAYALRAPYQKGIDRSLWGSLPGQLLLRTFDRADRLYQAMKLRGYGERFYGANLQGIRRKDILYLLGWISFFITARLINLPMFLGLLMTGRII